MDRDALYALVGGARRLYEELARDGKRLDELAARLRDESWHAGVARKKPDGEIDRDADRKTKATFRMIDKELERLEAELSSAGERTGT